MDENPNGCDKLRIIKLPQAKQLANGTCNGITLRNSDHQDGQNSDSQMLQADEIVKKTFIPRCIRVKSVKLPIALLQRRCNFSKRGF
ncbi:hypothetical protein [Anabaena sp. CCY 0017]|uniref:hypothetical protein n=1 Tax=Anabaena sp. CCY 0017 TaxID=3103866 RepID=UPI0039C6149E